VTDNAANFVKAFTLFPKDIRDENSNEDIENEEEVIISVDSVGQAVTNFQQDTSEIEDEEELPVLLPNEVMLGAAITPYIL